QHLAIEPRKRSRLGPEYRICAPDAGEVARTCGGGARAARRVPGGCTATPTQRRAGGGRRGRTSRAGGNGAAYAGGVGGGRGGAVGDKEAVLEVRVDSIEEYLTVEGGQIGRRKPLHIRVRDPGKFVGARGGAVGDPQVK